MVLNDSEVRALLDSRVDACRAKDIDRLMSLYSPGIVYYDVVPPLQFTGSADVRANFMRWFGEYDGPIGLETRDLDIAVSGDAAFAHMLHPDSGTRNNGPEGAIWVRSTVCCRVRARRHDHVPVLPLPVLPHPRHRAAEWPPAHVPFVIVELNGNNPARQQDWVDTMLTAHVTDPDPPAGEITAFFHLSTDGTRILHIGEWTSAQAHQDAYTRPGWGVGSATPEWEYMRIYPGFASITGKTYRHELHFAAPRGTRSEAVELTVRHQT